MSEAQPSSSPNPAWHQRLSARLTALAPALRAGGSRPLVTVIVIGILGVLALVLAGAVLFSVFRSPPPPVEVSLPREGSASGPVDDAPGEAGTPPAGGRVFVHAAGAVDRPGVYMVSGGARVADVIDAAGGPAPDADLNQLNLAAKVGDGERVYVPRRGELPPPGPGAGGAGAAIAGPAVTGPVDLNTATLEQLDALPGIGPATAQAILDYRRQRGRFKSVDQLLEVKGIGEAKLASLRSRVKV